MSSIIGLVQRLRLISNPPTANAAEGVAPLRFGILGAAAIAPDALILPARSHPEVEVTAVAARDKARAEVYAKKHGIPKVFGSYQELLDSPEIDVVYNPLPNALHFEWSIKTLNAGKHLLLEKPSCDTANETRQIFALAEKKGLIVLEAFHYRFHPVIQAAKKILDSGELGKLKAVSTTLSVGAGMFPPDDIRFNYEMGGGALMDMKEGLIPAKTLGYTLSSLRYLGGEPLAVTSASFIPTPKKSNVDRSTTAVLELPNHVTGTIQCDLSLPKTLGIVPALPVVKVFVEGTKGSLEILNFVGPHFYHSITVKPTGGATRTVKAYTFEDGDQNKGEFWWTTYRYQLEAFVDRLKGRPTRAWVEKEDSIANIEWIEKIYEKTGLGSRPKSSYVPPSEA